MRDTEYLMSLWLEMIRDASCRFQPHVLFFVTIGKNEMCFLNQQFYDTVSLRSLARNHYGIPKLRKNLRKQDKNYH